MIVDLLRRSTFPPAGTPVICGLSGGADSTALVRLAVAADCDVTAVHVDHGLRPSSATDADCARETAERLGIRFRSERVALADGPNLEARARVARQVALGPDAMTGHTADDQAETLLLALMRGSGASGLSAMAPGPTKPILALRRAETVAVCEAEGLRYVHDPTNSEPRFRRNRVRHELLPLMEAIAGRDLVPVLARQAELLRDEAELLEELAAVIDPHDAAALRSAPEPLARRAVRALLRAEHPPTAAEVERVLEVARLETKACEVEGGRRVSRSQGRLSVAE